MKMKTKYLISPLEIRNKYFLKKEDYLFILKSRNIGKNIYLKKDNRKVFIIGPCSIHSEDVLLEFAQKFKMLQKKYSDKYFFVMRAFFEKPRTKTGWKGFLYDPDLDGSNDLLKGLDKTRELLTKLIKMRIPLACEFLDPNFSKYFEDLISWGFIGARTVSSQIHRQLASKLSFPVGFKNNIDGNVDTSICAVVSSREKHCFASINSYGQLEVENTLGNFFSHIVLRGSKTSTNYDKSTIIKAKLKMLKHRINLPIIIDCSHGNSPTGYKDQIKCFNKSWDLLKNDNSIIGLMLESNLFSKNQKISKNLQYGVSITDSCLSFSETEKLFNSIS